MEEMSLVQETKYILEKLGHNPRKRYGQNFLISEEILDRIVKESNITKEDLVIEIGPGIGSLTKKILEVESKVIAVEIDRDLSEFLNDRFKMYENFSLINEDVLKVDLNRVIKESGYLRENVKIVANLPYYITTPIILNLFDLDIDSITVMVQKEVAERFTVKEYTKERSSITYTMEFNADAKILFYVGKNNFMPKPKIDSAIINLKLKTNEEKEEMIKNALSEIDVNDLSLEDISKVSNFTMDIIKFGFMHKRKKLIKALELSGIDKKKMENIFNKMEIDLNIRAEKISLNEYIKISYLYLFF